MAFEPGPAPGVVGRCYGDGASRVVYGWRSSLLLPEQRGSHYPAYRSLSRDRRLRKTAEFQAVHRQGRSRANQLVVLRMHPNGMPTSRIGLSVSRKVGNAVVRNQVKRRLREVVRQTSLKDGWDMVFIARTPAAQADFQGIWQAVHDLLRRADMMQACHSSGKELR